MIMEVADLAPSRALSPFKTGRWRGPNWLTMMITVIMMMATMMIMMMVMMMVLAPASGRF